MEYEFGRIVAARAGGFENLILGAGSNGQGCRLPRGGASRVGATFFEEQWGLPLCDRLDVDVFVDLEVAPLQLA